MGYCCCSFKSTAPRTRSKNFATVFQLIARSNMNCIARKILLDICANNNDGLLSGPTASQTCNIKWMY